MKNVIGEHLSRLNSFRNLGLIFDLDPTLIKIDDKILFFDEIVFSITIDDEIKSERIYQNGEREGIWFSWYDNGQKSEEGNYGNEEKEGLWITWDRNGQKSSEGNYVNGKEEGSGAYGEAGLWIFWWPNGQKRTEGNYRNGELIKEIF